MSIEQLKKILEGEKAWEVFKDSHEPIGQAGFYYKDNAEYFKYGHEAATNRLLPLLQKAVEMVIFVDLNTSFCPEHRRNQDIPFCSYNDCDIKIKAREFLAEIKKDGL